jgi:hypothetical protein
MVEEPAYIKGEELYLSVADVFNFLKIQNTPSPSYDSVTGYFINPQSVFTINRTLNRIVYHDETFELKPGDLIRTDNNLYMRSYYFGKVFGLECIFDFRALSVVMTTKLELPIIREMKQELMRQNISRLKGEVKADTTIKRSYPFFRFGMADWSILTTQQMPGNNNVVLNLRMGSILAGGEALLSLNYNNFTPFTEREQIYYWHFVNNDLTAFRQIYLGKVSAQTTSTLNGSLIGAQITNTPTQYRRSFSTYRLSDHTEPGWIVELYVNNVLVDYVKADASGFFTFEVPLVYGNSAITLRFYGPWGEEKTRDQAFSVPFNFLPPGQFEYVVSGGIVEDHKNSVLSRAAVSYGAAQRLTFGGGIEYLSTVKSGPTMPFVGLSLRVASNILISADYTYGVRGKGVLSYHMPSGLTFELNYTNYQVHQTAVINPYLEDRKIAISMPIHSKLFSSYVRFTLDQILLRRSKFLSSELLISGSLFGISTNLTTYGMFSTPGLPVITSTLALSFRFPKRFVFTPQVQYDFTGNQLISTKFGLEKSIFYHGIANLSYEHNFWGNINTVQIGLRYDFPGVQTAIAGNYSKGISEISESARGGLRFDSKTNYIGATSRACVGKCGIVIYPFLDFNGNGKRDPDEPKVTGLNVRLSGGRMEQSKKDSLIRIVDLEPFTRYFIEIDHSSFENVAWQIQKPTISVAVDPNSFKLVEIPVSVFGEISGMVYHNDNSSLTGQERIIIKFLRNDSSMVAKTISESDGYFTFMGLQPGSYIAMIDPIQLQRLDMASSPQSIAFTINRKIDGDQVSDVEFILRSLHPDTTALLTKAMGNDTSSTLAQKAVPGIEKTTDSIKGLKKEMVSEKKEFLVILPPQTALRKTVPVDSSKAVTENKEQQLPEVSKPGVPMTNASHPDTAGLSLQHEKVEISPVHPEVTVLQNKAHDTIILPEKKKQPEQAMPAPVVPPRIITEKMIIEDSCDFALQTSPSYTLASAMMALEKAETSGRPGMIISEGGKCRLRITGFCGRREAESFQMKLAANGYPGTELLRIRGYSIQVGAFHIKSHALTVMKRLTESFSRPVMIVMEDGYYKVRITGFMRFTEAKNFIPELNDSGFPDTYLLKSH